MLLSKLQIVELNEKDVRDIVHLLAALPLGGEGVTRWTPTAIAKLLGADWGWWRTVTGNLAKLPGLIAEKPELIPVDAAYDPARADPAAVAARGRRPQDGQVAAPVERG